MPTVEDYFDDDTDLPLPSSSKPRALPGSGTAGALLEEITSDDDDEIDFTKLAEQSRGVFGENAVAPPPGASSGNGKGKMIARDDGEMRPTQQGGPRMDPNTPMGGFMGDMMKLQQAEEERLEKLRRQYGNVNTQLDPSVFKGWNCIYPIYFDAKVSINGGRRVPRTSSLWWPQASQIAQACRSLGLPCVLEADKTHPADWENPGRVRVQFEKDGRFANPIVKNRTQLYKHISDQLTQHHPSLTFNPNTTPSARPSKPAAPAPTSSAGKSSKKSKSKPSAKSNAKSQKPVPPPRLSTRPPLAPAPAPSLDDRLPLHSPVVPAGVAVAAIKREREQEKERKKVGGGEEGGAPKPPKMKRMVVRGKR
ncbi:hypothetical protein IAT38_003929 [Cryptococcus sp. DSM 104549]